MYNNDEKITEVNLPRILECARIIEDCYRKGAINKDDVREACIMLKTAYNVGGVEVALLEVHATSMKKRLDEFLKIRKYVM